MGIRLREGYLGQGKNVQGNQSFLICSVEKLGRAYAYTLDSFMDALSLGDVDGRQDVSLLMRSYGETAILDGPYKASNIAKYMDRIKKMESEARPRAFDCATYLTNIIRLGDWKILSKLLSSDNQQ